MSLFRFGLILAAVGFAWLVMVWRVVVTLH